MRIIKSWSQILVQSKINFIDSRVLSTHSQVRWIVSWLSLIWINKIKHIYHYVLNFETINYHEFIKE